MKTRKFKISAMTLRQFEIEVRAESENDAIYKVRNMLAEELESKGKPITVDVDYVELA